MGSEAIGGLRLLRLFGAGSAEPVENKRAAGSKDPGPACLSSREQANHLLMQEISDLLLGNGLAVNGNNLLIAYSAFCGDDDRLARKICERRAAGMPITQEWLDQSKSPDNSLATADAILGNLAGSIDSFADTTKSARTVAETYNDEITAQITNAARADASEALSAMETLAKELIGRTKHFAVEMKRSGDEAQALRDELNKAKRDAEIDHLTGLPNRRAFEALLDHHYREARQEADNLCVAFCDIDHFKKVNDTHGHDTGDRVIRAIGEALARITNDNCHVARHGGEEFVMLFRGKSPQEAWAKLDAVRENFGGRRFVNRANEEPIGHITFSGGIADVFAYDHPRTALKAADEALYRAKAEGRNKVLLCA